MTDLHFTEINPTDALQTDSYFGDDEVVCYSRAFVAPLPGDGNRVELTVYIAVETREPESDGAPRWVVSDAVVYETYRDDSYEDEVVYNGDGSPMDYLVYFAEETAVEAAQTVVRSLRPETFDYSL